jgi:phosphotriesterase-related protein
MTPKSYTVNTVLGPVPAQQLGAVSVHEALLSVLPGAQYAFDVDIDRVSIFARLKAKLLAFKQAGGGTIVDATGQFHGRDPRLLEALSRSTGVHVVASTGQGPEELLGGYFLTPQTNPPTPWPAEKWSELFGKEVSQGMVVPRVERRGLAGLIATAVTRAGATPTDTELLKGSARAALETGAPISFVCGADALAELDVVLGEGLAADRVVVRGLDRADAPGLARAVADKGAYIALDHCGTEGTRDGVDYLADAERVALVGELRTAGHADKVLLSSSATGAAFGHPATEVAYTHVLTEIVPALTAAGLCDEDVQRLLVANPAALLALRPAH